MTVRGSASEPDRANIHRADEPTDEPSQESGGEPNDAGHDQTGGVRHDGAGHHGARDEIRGGLTHRDPSFLVLVVVTAEKT